MYRVVIDANVYIRFARSQNLSPLTERLIHYNFLPVVNNYLLSEIHEALTGNKWMDVHNANRLISLIQKFAFVTVENAVFIMSPDAKDNYLFDLSIQNNCAFIVSDDIQLYDVPLCPVPVRSTKWFLNSFPV